MKTKLIWAICIATVLFGACTKRGQQLEIYDVNGRKMQINGVNDLWQLPKGIYIIDGKKQLNY